MKLPRFLRLALWPLAVLYGLFTRIRAECYHRGWLRVRRLNGVVISIGNLTVGGTGKTPMVIWLAERLLADGKRVAILTRGYRGSQGCSDEVELLRAHLGDRVPIGVGKNRYEKGRRLETQGYDVFILDDGFQHLQLARDVDIVLLDASRPLESPGSGDLLPAGRSREPLSALRRADIVVMTRSSLQTSVAPRDSGGFSVFHANTRLVGYRFFGGNADLRGLSELGAGPLFAFCGVGNPDAFFSDLSRWQVNIVKKMAFRDHHRYSANDVRRLEEAATKAGAAALVTTEKDACNLRSLQFASLPVYIAVIDLVPNAESEFLAAVEGQIAACRGAAD